MIVDKLALLTFEFFMSEMMNRVPDDVDKREGSLIYTALAPTAYVLGRIAFQLHDVYNDTNLLTAENEWLDLKAAEYGALRRDATKARRIATFINLADEPYTPNRVGTRYMSTNADGSSQIYIAIEDRAGGTSVLEAEVAGDAGNTYVGPLLPMQTLNDLKSVTLGDIAVYGSDTESDNSLRSRALMATGVGAYGGNLQHYDLWVSAIAGVGAQQIYPIWAGGGTVGIVILDVTLHPATQYLIDLVQEKIAPVGTQTGLGLAPIGHLVTVYTAQELPIDLDVSVAYTPDYDIVQAQANVRAAITEYLQTKKEGWGKRDADSTYNLTVDKGGITAIVYSRSAGVNYFVCNSINGNTGTVFNIPQVLAQTPEGVTIPLIPSMGEITFHELI